MARSLFSRKNSRRAHDKVESPPSGRTEDAATRSEQVQGGPPQTTDPDENAVPDSISTSSAEKGHDGAAEEVREDPEVEPDGAPLADLPTVEELIKSWRTVLAAEARGDALRAADLIVPLTSAHPGGLAALYADTPTRLSTLVREPTALADTTARVQALGELASELRERHGQVTLHLAVGTASWAGPRAAHNVPVFSREVVVEVDESGEDTLRLLPGVELSGRLLREAKAAGVEIDQSELVAALGGPSGFSPAAALEIIADLGTNIPGFNLRDDLSLRILTHPDAALYRDLGDEDFLTRSPLVAALAGDRDARVEVVAPPASVDPTDRDPWKEVGVGDQSPQTQDIIEAIAAGGSYLVTPAEGANPMAAAVSSAAALAADGKSVLVVSNEPTSRALSSEFNEAGLGPIVADFFPETRVEVTTERLEEAMRDASLLPDEQSVETMRTALRRARSALAAYEEQLHAEFEDWGVTPFDALQVLTELTSDPDGPTTKVRLGADALAALSVDGGERARTLLEEASRQGLFTEDAQSGAWSQIELEDAAQVQYVLDATEVLAREALPAVRVQMARVAGQTGLRTATTLDGWAQQLDLIDRARALLDVFRPEVFERSPADLVVATASAEWRRDKGITLKGSKRRQRVKQARDLVRPGVHVPDLNRALIEVQECRHQWLAASLEDEPWPVIPEGVEACMETLRATNAELQIVAPYLEPVFGDLGSMPLDELCPIIEGLAEDANGARLVPQRLAVLRELRALGLEELVDDFRARRVDGEILGSELDLSWWASALGMMLTADPRLGGFDPELLQGLVHEIRVLDKAQTESLARSILDRVIARRADALALYSDQYTELVTALATGSTGPTLFGQFSLAWDLLPIVCAGPAAVPLVAPRGRGVDVIIAVGMEDVSLAAMAPVLARATDVVLVANSSARVPGTWMEEFSRFLTTLELPAPPLAVNGHFAELVVKYKPETSLVPIPTPRPRAAVKYLKVEGSGMPAPATVAIESSLAEAEAAAEYLVQQLIDRPDQTVAVATLSERHSERIKSALRRGMAANPSTKTLISSKGGMDRLVVQATELPTLRPAHVILSVGFAKTPHGRVIHDFGVLSAPGGIDVVEAIAQGAAGDLTVITSLASSEIDSSRLRHNGELALVELLSMAEGNLTAPATVDDGVHVPDDLLVDLADRLHRLGLPVVANLGSGRYRIPLAVGHPEVPGELLVAVLTDDPAYRSEPSLRVRDRYWPELLERVGWKVRTALSMAVFIDPDTETQTLVELVLDAVDDYYVRIGKPVTPAAAAALAAEGAQMRVGEVAATGAEDADMEFGSDAEPDDSDAESPTEPSILSGSTPAPASPTANEGGSEDLDGLGDNHVSASPPSGPLGQAETDPSSARGEDSARRPAITKGLPLAAYSDDQLDEVAAWLVSETPEASEEDLVDQLRETIGLRRRGAQSDTVLLNVIRRARS